MQIKPKRWTPIILLVLTFAMAIAFFIKSGLLAIITAPADWHRVNETRVISADAVNMTLSGPIKLNVRQGNTATIVVNAGKDQLTRIVTQQNGDTLEISQTDSWLFNWVRGLINLEEPVTVDMSLPALKNIATVGSGDTNVVGFSGDELELNVVGSGDIRFKGQYKKVSADIAGSGGIRFDASTFDEMTLNIMGSGEISASGQSRLLTAEIAGSGSLHARQLMTDSATISIAGSGNADIFAKQAVNISITGSGNVRVHGKPPKREVNSVGSGAVSFE